MPTSAPATVAIFNSSADTVEMLRIGLLREGHLAVNGYADIVKSGEMDFVAFMTTHRPDALIWDITPPYDRNWNFFKLLETSRLLEGCFVVLTTTHKEHLDALAGNGTAAIEIVGKPYDIARIVDAVSRGLAERAQLGPRALRAVSNVAAITPPPDKF